MATRAPDPLAAALDTHAALVTQLDSARTALAARTRRQSLLRTRTRTPSDLLARNRALEQQLARRLADLDSLRAHTLAKHHAAAALDHSHLVASHLASAPSSPLPAALADTLSTRDSRALALLATTSATHSTALDRAHMRRELLRLNRENARLVHELRRKGSLADPARRAHLVAQLDPPIRDYYERLKADLPLSLARVQLLSSVFTRLVAESAVPLSLPASTLGGGGLTAGGLSDKEEKALLDDEDEAGWEWTREALVRLLLFAGSDDVSSSPSFAGGADGEEDGEGGDGDGDGEGWEDGQELPREVRERVGRRREREEEDDSVEAGATNGVAKKGRKRKSAGA
ncbi:hypothetical protein Rhopal_007850-T1 [Rhodotorula paludigena]|uniref:Centromere protein H C-terminal domain-containing protein n=1 Tax=Rhodotorula paludigena TaxID=86838 RepID=A0AAV5GX16_9BASI|nr:hypothetical protein Rhopal_007850-T1 [Rhodotorula paludigena]